MTLMSKYQEAATKLGCYTPKDKKEYVGIEVECFLSMPKEIAAWHLVKSKLDDIVIIGRDASIKNPKDTFSAELRFISSIEDLKINLKRFQEFLDICEAEVNTSCGLHIHLDARHKNIEQMYYNLVISQQLLAKCVESYRLRCGYSKLFNELPWEPFKSKSHCISQQKGLNTVEVRLMEGTTDMIRVFNWIMLCRHIANKKISNIYFNAPAEKIIEKIKPSAAALVILKQNRVIK